MTIDTRPAPRRGPAAGLALLAALAVLGGCSEGATQAVGIGNGPAAVDSIAVSPPTARLEQVGQTQPFTATVFNAAGQTLDTQVTWSSADLGVATMDQGGVATAQGPGQTDIRATVGDVVGTAVLTVDPILGR